MVWKGARWRRPQAARQQVAAYLRFLVRGWRERRATPRLLAPLQMMIEPRLRALVADTVGVGADTLTPQTSLGEDLAMDSLDLVEVGVRAEAEFSIVFPDRDLVDLHTYGDLVAATTALVVHELRERRAEREQERVELKVGRGEMDVPRLLRVLDGSPYDRELLAEELRTTRTDERLEINTSPNATPAVLAELERALARAGVTGVTLRAGVPCAPDRTASDDAHHVEGSTDRNPAGSIDERATPALPLVDRLQAERETTVRHLVAGTPGCEDELRDRRTATNSSVDEFRSVIDAYLGVAEPSGPTVSAATGELRRLQDVRSAVDHFAMGPDEARAAYTAMADALLDCLPGTPGSGNDRPRRPLRAARRSADREAGSRSIGAPPA